MTELNRLLKHGAYRVFVCLDLNAACWDKVMGFLRCHNVFIFLYLIFTLICLIGFKRNNKD